MYEYSIPTSVQFNDLDKYLNEMAREGWRLVYLETFPASIDKSILMARTVLERKVTKKFKGGAPEMEF